MRRNLVGKHSRTLFVLLLCCVISSDAVDVTRFGPIRWQDVLDKLDDATTELMTGEGEPVMLMLGDSFMQCEEEYATEFCERKQEVGH